MTVSKIPFHPTAPTWRPPEGVGCRLRVTRRNGLSPPRDGTRAAPIPEVAQLFQKSCSEAWQVERCIFVLLVASKIVFSLC